MESLPNDDTLPPDVEAALEEYTSENYQMHMLMVDCDGDDWEAEVEARSKSQTAAAVHLRTLLAALAQDAARWRALRENGWEAFNSQIKAEHYVHGYGLSVVGETLDEAIDAAMKQEAK